MSWEDQGRQYHMWFGHGKAGAKNNRSEDGTAGTANKDIVKIATTLAYGAVAALPRAQRARAEAQLHEGTLDRLIKVLPVWMRNAHLDADTFAERFLGRDGDDPVAANLHGAVIDVSSASDPSLLGGAVEKFANAMKAIGQDGWRHNVAKLVDLIDTVAMPPDFNDERPVLLKDDKGNIIKNRNGEIIMRPAGMDPHYFVEQGLKDRAEEEALVNSGKEGNSELAIKRQVGRLLHFIQYGEWDAQRIGGQYHSEFVDYATVAIGLYAAASDIPKDYILYVQNQYAKYFSHFDPDRERDKVYTNLPVDNVKNTDIGYGLYRSGRIAATARKQ